MHQVAQKATTTGPSARASWRFTSPPSGVGRVQSGAAKVAARAPVSGRAQTSSTTAAAASIRGLGDMGAPWRFGERGAAIRR